MDLTNQSKQEASSCLDRLCSCPNHNSLIFDFLLILVGTLITDIVLALLALPSHLRMLAHSTHPVLPIPHRRMSIRAYVFPVNFIFTNIAPNVQAFVAGPAAKLGFLGDVGGVETGVVREFRRIGGFGSGRVGEVARTGLLLAVAGGVLGGG